MRQTHRHDLHHPRQEAVDIHWVGDAGQVLIHLPCTQQRTQRCGSSPCGWMVVDGYGSGGPRIRGAAPWAAITLQCADAASSAMHARLGLGQDRHAARASVHGPPSRRGQLTSGSASRAAALAVTMSRSEASLVPRVDWSSGEAFMAASSPLRSAGMAQARGGVCTRGPRGGAALPNPRKRNPAQPRVAASTMQQVPSICSQRAPKRGKDGVRQQQPPRPQAACHGSPSRVPARVSCTSPVAALVATVATRRVAGPSAAATSAGSAARQTSAGSAAAQFKSAGPHVLWPQQEKKRLGGAAGGEAQGRPVTAARQLQCMQQPAPHPPARQAQPASLAGRAGRCRP
jgi:hypothetical protein